MNTTAWLPRALLAFLLLTLTLSSSARDLDQDGAVLLEVELEEEDGVLVYEVELVTEDGTVRELELHASTGEVLKDEVED